MASKASGSRTILGISAFYHDSAAAIVKDGEIVAAAQEERFTRKRHDHEFPKNAIEYCVRGVVVSPVPASRTEVAPTSRGAGSPVLGLVPNVWTTLPGCVHRVARLRPKTGASRGRAPPCGGSE